MPYVGIIRSAEDELRIYRADFYNYLTGNKSKSEEEINVGEAINKILEKYFDNVEIEGIPVSSNVGDQPINEEILKGAKNRVKNLREYALNNNIEADFYVSSEAGITNLLGDWIDINAVVIEDAKGFQSVGTSQGFPIPNKYIDEIKETELGKVMDKIFSGKELGKGKVGISLLTKNEVSRIDLTRNAFIMALTSHINEDIWK